MQEQKDESQVISLPVTDSLKVAVIPSKSHEFIMPTKDVAVGYGICKSRLSHHLKEHSNELIEGKHFISGVAISATPLKGTQPHQRFWTKRGIVRLGFFIKSKQAKLFRDWAEDLVIERAEKKPTRTEIVKRDYGATFDLIQSAALLCGSRNKLANRLGISHAVLTHIAKRPWLVSESMVKAIETGCKNIIANENKVDTEAIEALIKVSDEKARITLFNKMKKGGLL